MNTYNDTDSGAEGRLMAFVCGALVGASVALLFAPMRGTDLRASLGDASRAGRDRIRRASREGRDWARHAAHDAGAWAQQTAQQANTRGRDALHRATEAVDTAVDRAKVAVDRGVNRAHEATDRARGVLDRGLDAARQTSHTVEQRAADALASTDERVRSAEERVKEQWS